MEKPENLRELIEQGHASLALLPEKNDYLFVGKKRLDLDRLDSLDGYTVPLISHDYGAKTPLMWNSLYEELGINVRNIMIVANPKESEIILSALKNDPKYLGGGLGVGFKEQLKYLDKLSPLDLKAVNIVVKEKGNLVGYNTDAQGFVRSLEDKFKEIGKKLEGSNIVLLGAGGVSKEVARLIASKNPNRVTILNRTYSKAVEIAYELNRQYGQVASGDSEGIIRGHLLNSDSRLKPDAVVNLTDKGSDGQLEEYSAFHPAEIKCDIRGSQNQNISRTISRELKRLNPEIIVADIVLPKNGKSITLRIAENEGLTNLLDGIPMVINQAAPAYVYVQEAHQNLHNSKVDEEKALKVFREVTK